MSQTVTLNGVSYTVPDPDDTGWGTYLTSYLTAIASNMLQKSGGSFNLTNDVDFGSTKGIISAYYKTSAGSLPSVGAFRLGNTDAVTWKGVSSDMSLVADSSTDGILNYNSVAIVTVSATQTLTNKTLTSPVINGATLGGLTQIEFEGSTPDDYETILTAAEPTADATVTIPNATTTLVGTDTAQTITNKRINSPKLNEDVALTATSTYLNRVDATSSIQTQLDAKQATIDSGNRLDASLVGTAGTVSNTEYDYLSTVTSNIQTQLDAKQATIDASNRLDADLIHDGSVSNTEFGYINSLTSNAQTQLDAKAPLSNPNFTGYADFDTITAPGAPGTSGQTRVYSNSGKLYFQGNGDASPTEIGSGGGAGDADTIQLKAANDFSAVDAAPWYTGKDEVPGGGGTLTGTWEISTSNPLINTDDKTNVFHYSNGGVDTKSSYFEIELDVPNYAKGHNLVTQLFYRTVGAEDTDFLFFARDRSGTYETTVNGSQSSVQTVTLTSATGFSVGDRFCIGDSSGDRHFRYVTAVSSNDVSFSGSTLSFSGGEAAVSKFFTDELDFITAENNTTNYEGKIRKWAFKINDTTTKIRVGFLYDNSATSTNELFFDQILLSSNQFLQTSSQGQSEGYEVYYQTDFWDSGSTYLFDESKLVPSGNSPTLANSNLITVADNAAGSASFITAKQNIILDVTVGADSSTSGEVRIYREGGLFYAGVGPNGSTSLQEATASIKLSKNESIYFWNRNPESRNGFMILTATPQVNDVVLLNSASDEIFTDWQDYGSSVGDVFYTTSWAAGGANTVEKAVWRRIGSEMELKIDFVVAGSGTVSSDYGILRIPSGYTIDKTKIGGGQKTILGTYYKTYSNSDFNTTSMSGVVTTRDDYEQYLYLSYQSKSDHTIELNSINAFANHNERFMVNVKIPIQGWTSTFNPVLSMPLVDLGHPVECYIAYLQNSFWDGSAGGHKYLWEKSLLVPQGGTPALASSNLITISDITSGSNTVTAITAKQDITLTVGIMGRTAANGFVGFYNSSDQIISFQGQSENHWEAEATLTLTLSSGDYIYGYLQDSSTSYGLYGGMTLTAERKLSGNMAHIIKPAIAIISNTQAAYNYTEGKFSAANTWDTRVLNTIKGESWFINSLSSNVFELQAGMYKVFAQAPFWYADESNIRLYNTDDSSVLVQGIKGQRANLYSSASAQVANLHGVFTLTSAKSMKIQQIADYAHASDVNQLGYNSAGATDSGETIFTTVVIEKLK